MKIEDMEIREILVAKGITWKVKQDAILYQYLMSSLIVNTCEKELRLHVIRRGSHWKSEHGGMDASKCIQQFIDFVDQYKDNPPLYPASLLDSKSKS